jgi:hypothetical protein
MLAKYGDNMKLGKKIRFRHENEPNEKNEPKFRFRLKLEFRSKSYFFDHYFRSCLFRLFLP